MKKIIFLIAFLLAILSVFTNAYAQSVSSDSWGKTLKTHQAVTFDSDTLYHTITLNETDKGTVVLDNDRTFFCEGVNAFETVQNLNNEGITTVLVPQWWGEAQETSFFVAIKGYPFYQWSILVKTQEGAGVVNTFGKTQFFPWETGVPHDINAFYFKSGKLVPCYLKCQYGLFSWVDLEGNLVISRSVHDHASLQMLAQIWHVPSLR